MLILQLAKQQIIEFYRSIKISISVSLTILIEKMKICSTIINIGIGLRSDELSEL